MRKLLLPLLLGSIVLASCGGGGDIVPPAPFSAAVFGDIPYGTSPTDTSQQALLPAFVAAVNADKDVSLAFHGGDLHSGKEYCTKAYDQAMFQQYSKLTMPFVYVPGDNEWTDCHKAGEGGGTYNSTTGAIDYVKDASGNPVDYANGNPVDNLALVRSMFFPQPGTTLGGAMAVHSQGKEFDPAFPADAQFVENVWFEKNGVLFMTVNMPGGSNNDTDIWYGAPTMSAQQATEVAERSAANLRWIKVAFERAKAANDSAVVIVEQADMWDLDGKATNAHIAQYKPFIDAIATQTTSFGKPVLLLNGDSHIFRSDNPLVKGSPCVYEPSSGAAAVACTFDSYDNQPNGYNVPNFHRVVWHGSTSPLEYLKLKVDVAANAANGTSAFGPFSWARVKVQ